MSLPTNVGDREQAKFTENSNGDAAIRTVTELSGSAPLDVTPVTPVATDYLPVRLTNGTSFYNATGGVGGGGSGDGSILDGADPTIMATVTAAHALKVDGSAVTQPVSATSLPLPDGAASESTLGQVAAAFNDCTGGNNGTFLPTSLFQFGGINPANDHLRAIQVSDTHLLRTEVAETVLPPGAATESTLATVSSQLAAGIPVQGVTAAAASPTENPVLFAGKTSNGAPGVYKKTVPTVSNGGEDGDGNQRDTLDVWDWSAGSNKVVTASFTSGSGNLDFVQGGGPSIFLDISGTWTGSISVTCTVASNSPTVMLRALNSPTGLSSITANGLYVVEGAYNTGVSIVNSVATGTADVYALSVPNVDTGTRVWQAGTWNIRNQDGSGTALTSTSGKLDVQVGNASIPVTGTFWQATQPVSGSVSVSNLPATQPVSGTFWQATQPVSIASMPSTPVTGTFWQATQPVSAASLPLPSGASSETTLSALNTKFAPLVVTGSAAVNGADCIASTDVSGYGTVTVQFSNTFVATTSFQGSNDNVNFVTVILGSISTPATQPVGSATTASIYSGPVNFKYFRVRLTAYTSGTVDATAVFKKEAIPYSGGQIVRLNDGTNAAKFLASSTAAATTDTALVVAVSPNNVMKSGDGTTAIKVVAASTAVAAADPAVAVAISPNNGVSLGISTGKTLVLKTGTLASSATTADQVILTYTVTSGKTFYLEYFNITARLTTYAATATNFGDASLESPASTKLFTQMICNAGAPDLSGWTFSEPIPIASGTVIRVVCTPSAATAFTWRANFGGYEK